MLIIELLIIGIINPTFFNIENILYSSNDFMHITIVAIPFTLIIITGGIDISVTSVMGLTSIVFGMAYKFLELPILLSIVIALSIASLCGIINGLLVAKTDINPLIITLGTMFLYRGIAISLAGSSGAVGYNGITGFPDFFLNLAYGSVGFIPIPL